ncbi:MAG: hypothetical protein Q9160_002547 [Pyrenula sp. 1 TL-2023]
MRKFLLSILCASTAVASERAFSIKDDVLAYPQYEIVYSNKWISARDAERLLDKERSFTQSPSDGTGHEEQDSETHSEPDPFSIEDSVKAYERIISHERSYLCAVPRIDASAENETSHALSKADQDKELARATDRGWELLKEMEGKCMYHVSGWWSYSFCYNSQIKQYHHLPAEAGRPVWPPQEDPSTPAYVLGRFSGQGSHRPREDKNGKSTTDVTALQTQGDTRYLVQHLGGGTVCDLTGKERHIEVQFHCNAQSADQIFTIKEVSTCAYLLVLYTPRLCNDVAFQPPQENKPFPVTCKEILQPEDVQAWEEEKMRESTDLLTKDKSQGPPMVGNIVVGAQKRVGRDGKRIEKGKIIKLPGENAEVVAKKEGSKIHRLSKAELRRINVDEATIESMREELQSVAGTNDWRLEVVDDQNGFREIRGIVEVDGEDEEPSQERPTMEQKKKHDSNKEKQTEDEDEDGSEEAFKEDL